MEDVLFALKTRNKTYLMDENLLIHIVWRKHSLAHYKDKEVKVVKTWQGADGQPIVQYQFREDFRGRDVIQSVVFKPVWAGYHQAIADDIKHKTNNSVYGSTFETWKQVNGVEAIQRWEERTQEKWPPIRETKLDKKAKCAEAEMGR